jgi:hypothetical protein
MPLLRPKINDRAKTGQRGQTEVARERSERLVKLVAKRTGICVYLDIDVINWLKKSGKPSELANEILMKKFFLEKSKIENNVNLSELENQIKELSVMRDSINGEIKILEENASLIKRTEESLKSEKERKDKDELPEIPSYKIHTMEIVENNIREGKEDDIFNELYELFKKDRNFINDEKLMQDFKRRFKERWDNWIININDIKLYCAYKMRQENGEKFVCGTYGNYCPYKKKGQ